MDFALRQVRIRHYRRARPGPRAHLAASTLAERFILRRHPLDREVPLHLSIKSQFRQEVLDPRRDVVSTIQLDLLLVCTRKYKLFWITDTTMG